MADGTAGATVVGIDDVLEGPAVAAARDLGVADGVVVARFPRDQAGVAGPPSLHEVEPLVLTQRTMVVGLGGSLEQSGDGRDVALAQLPLDLDAMHRRRG